MLTYLYVALGGAIGSTARAWMASAVARALGPDFPWGTIFINILGSFVIGFFGALTASDGRFPSHPDARAFVMVGICGGFTTFSSFSLQTLDLARDGKLGAAFANIAISVVFCLAAVTAGFASAQFVNRSATLPKDAAEQAIGRAVLAVLDTPERVSALLTSGARLLSIEGGGTLQALAVSEPPIPELLAPDEVLSPATEARMRSEDAGWAEALGAQFKEWEAVHRPGGVTPVMIRLEGDIGDLVAEYGSSCSAAVIASARETGKDRRALHAAIFGTGRPVLVTPPGSAAAFGRVVAVAWKDDTRAAKAVLAALPILAKAKAVHILQARATAAIVPDIFLEHGVAAVAHTVPDDSGPAGAALLAMAHRLGADLLVMGAFAHGEWREYVLGGVTRYMLGHADLPLFMQH